MNWSTRIGTSTFQLAVYFKYYLTDLLNQIRTSIEFSLLHVPCYCYQAFVNAWKLACNTSNSVFLVPNGRRYLVNATRFRGPCSDNFIVQVVSYTIFTFLSKTRRLCLGISLQIILEPLCPPLVMSDELFFSLLYLLGTDRRNDCSARWAEKLGSEKPANLAWFFQSDWCPFPRGWSYWWLRKQMVGSIMQKEQVKCNVIF